MPEGNGLPDGGPELDEHERAHLRDMLEKRKWRRTFVKISRMIASWVTVVFGALFAVMKAIELWVLKNIP